MIEFTEKPYPGRPGSDIASCEVNGKRYELVNGSGAIHAVCRLLRWDGIPDQPWRANGGASYGPSIYQMADTTVSDGDRGCRVIKFSPFPCIGRGKKGGSS